jgi:Tfp pilus assembly PilM family ATPase
MSTARLLPRGNAMLGKNKLLSDKRRFAAGIDVSPREVRLVIASRKRRSASPVRVEWLGTAPLAVGAMSGAQLVDRAAVAAALSSLCARWPRRRAMRGMPCAMAIPGGATAIATFELDAIVSPRGRGRRLEEIDEIDELEPVMLEEAERLCGLERDALSIDWWASEGQADPRVVPHSDGAASVRRASRVTLAAAPRRHLEARVEVAACAGVALAAVDGEPLAALRALAYAAEHARPPNDRYAAVWAGYDGIYGWRIADRAVEASVRFPGGDHADLESAFGAIAARGSRERAFVGGDLRLLERVGLSLADIGERLGCRAEPFDCAPLCVDSSFLAGRARVSHAPTFAVAFGLALRGVTE